MMEATEKAAKLTAEELETVKKQLYKFVCGTCDMGRSTPAQLAEALPRAADVLLTHFG